MPPYATLVYPIDCPFCQKVAGQEFIFLEGYLPEDSQVDLCLGERIENLPREFSGLYRTRAFSLCNLCQQTLTSLITLDRGRLQGIEVFPRAIQELLLHFPDCLYLQNSDDGD